MTGPRRSIWLCCRNRHGFTLVELLVTLTIVGILASAAIFAMAAATETAKAAKTRTTIAKLNSLLMQRWQSYRTRRVPLLGSTRGLRPNQVTMLQLGGLRELMLIELPDRWDDVDPNIYQPQTIQPTALAMAYRRRFANNTNPTTGSLDKPSPRYQGAECLYLIISMATGDGESMEQFSDSDVGDVDQDGALEFIDGWGNPIRFLRWPAGFVSDLQPLVEPARARDPEGDHDPFDPFLRDLKAYRLVPLVYSAGPDEVYDVVINTDQGFSYPSSAGVLDPYTIVNPNEPPEDQVMRGTQKDVDQDGTEGWADNIHNHLMGLK